MQINGLGEISFEQLDNELAKGARFVVYSYTVSIIILTFTHRSEVYYIRANEGQVGRGIPFTLISIFAGWWGIPFGPIFTCVSIFKNFAGGTDVTGEVLAALQQSPQGQNAQRRAEWEFRQDADPYDDV